ncbi:hypothetical protein D3C84_1139610 [compost metagenome]
MVDAIGTVFREELRHGVVDLARRLQVRADGLLQHDTGVFAQANLRQVLADRPIHRSRGGEIGNDLLG